LEDGPAGWKTIISVTKSPVSNTEFHFRKELLTTCGINLLPVVRSEISHGKSGSGRHSGNLNGGKRNSKEIEM
jgi:hypothetical protein